MWMIAWLAAGALAAPLPEAQGVAEDGPARLSADALRAMDTRQFAATVGDGDTLRWLGRADRAANTQAGVLGLTGLTAGVTALLFASGGGNVTPQVPPTERTTTAALLAGTGVGVALLGLVPHARLKAQRRTPTVYYSPEELDRWIDTYQTADREP